jgi:hypothetical protein
MVGREVNLDPKKGGVARISRIGEIIGVNRRDAETRRRARVFASAKASAHWIFELQKNIQHSTFNAQYRRELEVEYQTLNVFWVH